MITNEYFEFYNELGEKYPESETVYKTGSGRRRMRMLQSWLEERSGLTLDLGCNDGPFHPYIEDYIGLDVAIACLARFNRPRVWALGECLPFRENVFERIIMIETLEHIPDRDEVMAGCFRVLKPGGEIIITCPGGNKPWRKKLSGRISKSYGVAPRIYLDGQISESYMRDLLERHGFIVDKVGIFKRRCLSFSHKPRASE